MIIYHPIVLDIVAIKRLLFTKPHQHKWGFRKLIVVFILTDGQHY